MGAYAVQLASHAGATVIATASGDDEAYLRSIGASRVINYREAQFEKVLRDKIDVVFDLVGGDTQNRSFLVLKEGGYLISAVQPVSQEEATRHHATGTMMRLAPSGDVLGRIARLLPGKGGMRLWAIVWPSEPGNRRGSDGSDENYARSH